MSVIAPLSSAPLQVYCESLLVMNILNNGIGAIGIITKFLPLFVYSGLYKSDNSLTRLFYIGNSMQIGGTASGSIIITDNTVSVGDQITVQYHY